MSEIVIDKDPDEQDIKRLNTEYLDAVLEQIDERLLFEKLKERVPIVGAMAEENRQYNALLHRLAVVFQKYPLLIDENQVKKEGHDPEKAVRETTESIQMVRVLAARYQ